MLRLDGEWSGHFDGERSVELRGLEGHHRLYSVAWGTSPEPAAAAAAAQLRWRLASFISANSTGPRMTSIRIGNRASA